ncbi:hypothetical protein C8J57DRAFT_1533784 [Mycena rebaudengoi]|nr:hypothetical protein C8J57DRAFT_1533784 [Mycena rebaudengoi]
MSRTAIYQTQLDGYVRIARRLRPSTTRREVIDVDTTAIEVIDVDACIFPGPQRFFTFEGKDWYPINVDEGFSEDDAIDVEAWTTLSEAPGSWTANDEDTAVPSSSEVWAKARAVHRSPGTPRKHTAPRSTRLRDIKEWKFTLEETRQQIIHKLKLTYVPDDWQIHLIIRILRGFDSIFLAGTGYGKSLIFEAVAALGGKKKVTIVVCPLKALEANQVKQATERINAILVNEDNAKDTAVWKRAEKSAQLVYISPEMALSDQFGRLWTNQKFNRLNVFTQLKHNLPSPIL